MFSCLQAYTYFAFGPNSMIGFVPPLEKFRADCSQGILAVIQCIIFCPTVCCPNYEDKVYRTVILPVFVGVKLGSSHSVSNRRRGVPEYGATEDILT